MEDVPLCPLCDRPIPADAPQSLHHLVPKSKGGKGGETVLLHHICHKEIHVSLTEAELGTRAKDVTHLALLVRGLCLQMKLQTHKTYLCHWM